jgi:hypothetical protein
VARNLEFFGPHRGQMNSIMIQPGNIPRVFVTFVHFLFYFFLLYFNDLKLDDGLIKLMFYLVICLISYYYCGILDPGYLDKSLDDAEDLLERDVYLCDECNIYVPLRSKHCKQCKSCVDRFDHHCYFIGGCVGRANHRAYFFYLLAQMLYIGYNFIYTFHFYKEFKDEYIMRNMMVMVMQFIMLVLMCIPFGLFWFHLFLIITNQTTWEVTKRHKISYLMNLNGFSSPFDEGCCFNLKQFCCDMPSGPIDWKIKGNKKKSVDVNMSENLWDNKHYSCC